MRPTSAPGSAAELYTDYARHYALGGSPVYAALAERIAGDETALRLIERVPRREQQPNLVLAVMRLLGAPLAEPDVAVDWLREHWEAVRPQLEVRHTQTNELARCAAFLAGYAGLPGPLALLDLGTSAGLTLVPDRWDHRFVGTDGATVAELGHAAGPGGVRIDTVIEGRLPAGMRVPEIAWRRGLDRNPLDPTDPGVREWLTLLVWPGLEPRADRLEAGLSVLAQDPPEVVAGDMVADLRAVAAEAPDDATLVIQHSAALAYLDDDGRHGVLEAIQAVTRDRSGATHRLGLEGPAVVPGLTGPALERAHEEDLFVVSRDDEVLGLTSGHGGRLVWFGDAAP